MKPLMFLIGIFLTFVGIVHVWTVVSVFISVGGNLDFSRGPLVMLIGGLLLIIGASLMAPENDGL